MKTTLQQLKSISLAKAIIACCCLFLCFHLSAQVPDYISVKKKNGITVMNFYAGMHMKFITSDHNTYEGPIAAIAKDTVFIKFFQTTSYQTVLGNIHTDTVHTEIIPFHYKEFKMIYVPPKNGRQSILVPVGGLLAIGGAGYDVVNIVNGLYNGDAVFKGKNLTNLGIGAAAAIAGVFITKKSIKSARAKNNYRIVYVNMSD